MTLRGDKERMRRVATPNEYRIWRLHSRMRNRVVRRDVPMVPFTWRELAARLEYLGGTCYVCGGPGGTLDHVKPLGCGGTHCLANLRIACHDCNTSKASRWWGARRLGPLLEDVRADAARLRQSRADKDAYRRHLEAEEQAWAAEFGDVSVFTDPDAEYRAALRAAEVTDE